MMEAGAEAYDVNGKLQFNSRFPTFALRASGTAQTSTVSGAGASEPSRLVVPYTDSFPNALVALAGGGGYGAAFNRRLSDGRRSFSSDAPVGTSFNYYLFEESRTFPRSTQPSAEAIDENGKVTFSTDARAMKSMGRISGGSYSAGGKSLAFCQATFAGSLSYSNEEQEFEGWYYDQNFVLYGGSIINGGSGVAIREIPYSSGRFGPEGNVPGNAFTQQSTFFIVDVTGYPIGRVFY